MTANAVPRVVLASASPRRRELLQGLGLEVIVQPAHVDETPRPGEAPADLVCRLARSKAVAVSAEQPPAAGLRVILAADTAVVVDGRFLGKPEDERHAEAMLRELRGRGHEVLTGVWLLRTDDARATGGVAVTRVVFRDYGDDWLRAYARSSEPKDKAGAYAIQGRGAMLIEGIEGSWSNVVGLPLERLPGWLTEIGFSLCELLDWDVSGDQSEGASFT